MCSLRRFSTFLLQILIHSILVVFISEASGTVFEAEKVRLSEKLWFHRSCFTCKACHGFLDVLRWDDDGGYDYDGGYDDGNLIGNNDG